MYKWYFITFEDLIPLVKPSSQFELFLINELCKTERTFHKLWEGKRHMTYATCEIAKWIQKSYYEMRSRLKNIFSPSADENSQSTPKPWVCQRWSFLSKKTAHYVPSCCLPVIQTDKTSSWSDYVVSFVRLICASEKNCMQILNVWTRPSLRTAKHLNITWKTLFFVGNHLQSKQQMASAY